MSLCYLKIGRMVRGPTALRPYSFWWRAGYWVLVGMLWATCNIIPWLRPRCQGNGNPKEKRVGLQRGSTGVQWCHPRLLFHPFPCSAAAAFEGWFPVESRNGGSSYRCHSQGPERLFLPVPLLKTGNIFPCSNVTPSGAPSPSHWQELSYMLTPKSITAKGSTTPSLA